ncbi:MAG: hypothetical protein ACOY9Y_05785 [Bacillota bacterium]
MAGHLVGSQKVGVLRAWTTTAPGLVVIYFRTVFNGWYGMTPLGFPALPAAFTPSPAGSLTIVLLVTAIAVAVYSLL